MAVSLTLSTAPLEQPAMDYAFLRQEGIRHLERMAGHLWTDFNAHDPGITILEQLCYAITDLAHRINYEMPDLMTRSGEETYDSFYGPAQILTTQPVTMTDLRKLVIDVEGVKNAWIEKVEAQPVPLFFDASENVLRLQGDALRAEPIYLKGLYRVLIEASDLLYVDSTLESGEIEHQVTQRLHDHRGLCEDFETIRVLAPQDIQVQARIDIAAVDDAESILLQIYQRIAEYISPSVPFQTLSQCLARGLQTDDIFDGPRLDHGFIDDADLQRAKRRWALRTSDLIREIMDVPGVRAVRTISLSNGATQEPWSLILDPTRTPKLDLSEPTITLERNQLAVSIDQGRVTEAYFQAIRESAAFQPLPADEQERPPPPGRDRRVDQYHSIQHQFPATYGIGALGLPESASPTRKAQAKQLQAYLMFFDQLLANYFAQLAHVKDLFSVSAPGAETYFSQMIDDPALGLECIRLSDPATRESRLQQLTENPYGTGEEDQPDYRRRNRFLDHLLARFAETFTDYALVLNDGVTETDPPEHVVSAPEKVARDKQAFLRDYPQLSGGRGSACNYLKAAGPNNLSGLEQRLQRKLGLDKSQEEDILLIEHILLRPMPEDTEQVVPLLAAVNHDPYSLQLTVVLPDWPARYQHPVFRAFIERTISEETPAHLVADIQWLDQERMAIFKSAYAAWLEKRRDYWATQLGIKP